MSPQRWSRLDNLFHAALDHSPDEIDGFLRRECGEDAELYSEVRRMLESHSRAGLLDQSPWPPGPVSQSDIPTESLSQSQPVFTTGDLVSGRYRIVRFINRGGMGEVYEAEDLELRERTALKTLLPSIADDTRMIARFKQEIQLSRKVGHPNVCRVFDLARHSVDASGPSTYFLTMEFLPGETLSARLQRERRLSLDVALPIIQQIADALDAAHRAGVIHRDLKPSNVMLVPEGAGIRAVVTDFGLARSVHIGEATATRSSQLMGTFGYMAPELFSGRGASIASDVYALGMVACKMLTGELPSAADTIESAAPPASLGRLAADVDPASHQAILRAIDPRPGARFATAAAFVDGLRGGTSPSITVTITPAARFRIAAVIALLFLTAAVFFGWRSWTAYRSRPSPEAEAYFKKGVEQIHSGAYYAATKTLEQATRSTPAYPMAHARLAEAWIELQIPEKAKSEMLATRRENLSHLSDIDRIFIEAVDLTIARDFTGALAKYEQLHNRAPEAFEIDLGRANEKAQRRPAATESFRRAADGPTHNPAAWLRLAVLYSRSAKPDQADEAFRQAEDRYRLDNNLEGMIELAFQRGNAANRRGQYEEGAIQLEKARASARLAGNPHQEILATLRLAGAAYMMSDANLAEQHAVEAIRIARLNQMENLAVTGVVALGNVYQDKRVFPVAEKYYREALEFARRSSAHTLAAYCLLSLASLHDVTRNYGEMLAEAREALSFYELNGYLTESSRCLTMIGRYQRDHGDWDASLASFTKALSIAEKAQDRSGIVLGHSSVGSLLAARERYPEALEHYRKNIDIAVDPADKAYAALQSGSVLWQLGQYEQALKTLESADSYAEKDPTLRLRLLRTRAELALSQDRPKDAAEGARKALALATTNDPLTVADLKRILGLSLIASGDRQGRRYCEEGLGAVSGSGNVRALLAARLAVQRARVETGDRSGALAMFKEIDPTLEGSPETRWRALALATKVDPQYRARAREALDALSRLWGNPAWNQYLTRPDIQFLARPLLQGNSASQ